MIGNDIIDLSLAKTQSNWQRPGFLEKQFTNSEIDLIRKSETPFLLVWRMWSMKEAAYKVVVQQEHRRFFAPKKFECTIIDDTNGEVHFKDQVFEATSETTSKYIYTSVGKANFQWIGQQVNSEDFLKLIERQTGIAATQLKIRKNALGVPNIYNNGQLFSRSFTKTHHGDYQAFACKSGFHYSETLTYKIKLDI